MNSQQGEHMLALNISAIPVSGSGVVVVAKALRGIAPLRLTIKNEGSNALSAAAVRQGPDDTMLDAGDTATFGSLAGGAVASLVLPAPVEYLEVTASCASGTTLRVAIADAVSGA